MDKKYQYWKGDTIESMTGNNILVFGSNPEGRHGAGAALLATKFGAKRHKGRGLHGNTYALITKNLTAGFKEKETGITYAKEGYRSVSPSQVSQNIDELYDFARTNPHLKFFIIYKYESWDNGSVKKSLNGYNSVELWNLFTNSKDVPENIRFHSSFRSLAEPNYKTGELVPGI
jgi:hypothetical protein